MALGAKKKTIKDMTQDWMKGHMITGLPSGNAEFCRSIGILMPSSPTEQELKEAATKCDDIGIITEMISDLQEATMVLLNKEPITKKEVDDLKKFNKLINQSFETMKAACKAWCVATGRASEEDFKEGNFEVTQEDIDKELLLMEIEPKDWKPEAPKEWSPDGESTGSEEVC